MNVLILSQREYVLSYLCVPVSAVRKYGFAEDMVAR